MRLHGHFLLRSFVQRAYRYSDKKVTIQTDIHRSTINDLINAKYSLKYEGITICTVLPEMA